MLAALGMGVVVSALSRTTAGLVAPLELALLAVVGAALYVVLLRFTAPHLFAAGVALARRKLRTTGTDPSAG